MDDEDAPQATPITPVHEILHGLFGLLFGEAVEINVILHRQFAPLQPLHKLSAESFDGSLDVFVAESNVQQIGRAHV